MRPTWVEPVKLNLRTISLSHSVLPTSIASPLIFNKISAGKPALRANTSSAYAVKGVCSAGLTNIEQPAAIAGAALRVIIAAGKFHGVIAAVTPIACLITSKR